MAAAAERVGMSARAALDLSWAHSRQATEALSSALGVKILEPPAVDISHRVSGASFCDVHTYFGGLARLVGRPHPRVRESGADAQTDAAAMELLRAEHCDAADATAPFAATGCYGIVTRRDEFWSCATPFATRALQRRADAYASLMPAWPQEADEPSRRGMAPRAPAALSSDDSRAAIDAALRAALHPTEMAATDDEDAAHGVGGAAGGGIGGAAGGGGGCGGGGGGGGGAHTDTEFVALRLFTGPMADKYHAVPVQRPAATRLCRRLPPPLPTDAG